MSGFHSAGAASVAFLSTHRSLITLVLAVTGMIFWRTTFKILFAPVGALLMIVTMARNGKLARIYARRLTDLAVFIAGRKRLSLREEWGAHLAGNDGRELSPQEKLRTASGFAVAAVRYRLRDASLLAWKVTDAVLTSRPLSNTFVLSPATAAALTILHYDGVTGMLRSVGSIAAAGGTLYTLVRVGRWYRDVKPPEPKARRARE